MKSKRKLLSLILALSMAIGSFTALPMAASADEDVENPTVSLMTDDTADETTDTEADSDTEAAASENGIVYENGSIKVTYDAEQDAKLIVAKYYSDGTLNSVTLDDISLIEGTVTVAYDLEDEAAKIMVWDGLDTMVPLLSLSVDGTVEEAPTPTAAVATPTAEPGEATEVPTTTPTTEPTEIPAYGTEGNPYYIIDFEGDSTGSKVWGYTSSSENVTGVESDDELVTYYVGSSNRYGGAISVNSDTTYGNFAYVTAAQFADADANNKRAPSIQINDPKDISEITDGNVYMFKFNFKATNASGAIYLNDNTDLPTGDFIKIPMTNVTLNTWLTAYISVDPSTNMCIAEIYNGDSLVTTETNTYTTTGNPSRLRFLGSSTYYYYSIDNISVYEETPELSYQVTYTIDDTTTLELVVAEGSPENVPDTDKTGYVFDGWAMNDDTTTLYTTEQVKAMTITANTSFTAQYHVDSTYVQSVDSVTFTTSQSTAIYNPAEDTTDTYTYTVQVLSDIGNDITSDCTIDWDIVGTYGDDNYIELIPQTDTSTAILSVRNGVSNYYGYIEATATYDPENSEDDADITENAAQAPYAILGKTETTNIIPMGGYPIDMGDYADALVGYKATSQDLTSQDLVLNNWSIYGSNAARDLELVWADDEQTEKALKFSSTGGDRGGSGSSTVGVYQWTAQSSQYVIDVTLQAASGGSIGVYTNTPNNSATAECVFDISGGVLTAGTSTITGLSSDAYYRVVMICDPVSHTYYVVAYDDDGNCLGETDVVEGGTGTMKYLCVYGAYPVYIKSLRAYNPTIASITINSDDAVKIPENETDEDVTADLSATCLDSDGFKILSDVTWSLGDDYNGVTLTGSGQTATLTVEYGASGGTIEVIATNGSASVTKDITLTSSSNTISMTGTSSITIPFSGEENIVETYTAKTVDKEGEDVADDTITYSFLKSDGSTPLDTLPTGITFDSETGELTVTSEASPIVMYLKATNSEGLSNKKKINIHGMSFDFGTDDAEEGYTQITSATLYTDTLGMGFETTTGLTDAEDSVSGTSAYKFKAAVPNGNYTVTVDTTSSTMTSEVVDVATTAGVSTGISKSGTSFSVAVCDGVLDLTFAADSTVSSLVIAQATAKTQQQTPALFAVGDSTTKNSGQASSTDYRNYASWGNCVTEDMYKGSFSSFSNNGMAGRNAVSFYNEGRMESVLLSIAPGDYVTINMGINGSESNAVFTELVGEYYVEGVIQRGGIPVIVTSTPDGPNSTSSSYTGVTFNNSTGTFDGTTFTVNRGTAARNGLLRAIAEDKELNIIELGYWGEDYFNNLLTMDFTTEVLPLANTANSTVDGYTAPENVFQVVQSWYTDHNHYTSELGSVIAQYMVDSVAKIANGDTSFSYENDTHISEQ